MSGNHTRRLLSMSLKFAAEPLERDGRDLTAEGNEQENQGVTRWQLSRRSFVLLQKTRALDSSPMTVLPRSGRVGVLVAFDMS